MRQHNMNRWNAAVAGLIITGATLLVACGGNDGEDASAAPDPAATRPAATATQAVENPAATPTRADVEATATSVVAQPTPTPATSNPVPIATATQPAPPPVQPTTAPPPPPTGTTVTITARAVKFVPPSVTVALGMRVTAIFNNDDAGVAHDLVLRDPSGAKVGATEVFTGPAIRQFTFDAAVAGSYSMSCTIHRSMGGSIIVE